MISTPAASICGPPMPKIATSRRCLSAEARRAAYISPEASPAESKSGMGGMCGDGHGQSLARSAGEASGDMYAARLASALKQRLDVAIFGMGGPQMLAAGVEIITDYSEVSVVGITEVLKRLPSLTRAMRHLVDEAQRRKPPLAILKIGRA